MTIRFPIALSIDLKIVASPYFNEQHAFRSISKLFPRHPTSTRSRDCGWPTIAIEVGYTETYQKVAQDPGSLLNGSERRDAKEQFLGSLDTPTRRPKYRLPKGNV